MKMDLDKNSQYSTGLQTIFKCIRMIQTHTCERLVRLLRASCIPHLPHPM